MMKRFIWIILLVSLQCGSFLYAQKVNKKSIEKEIAIELKRMETGGWKLWNSNEAWQSVLSKKYTKQNEPMIMADGEWTNRYIVCTASAEHRSLNTALQLAETKARSEIVSKMKTQVDVTFVQTSRTKTSSSTIVTTENRTGTAINKHADLKMTQSEKIFTIYRKTDNDVYVVEVCMALDLKEE